MTSRVDIDNQNGPDIGGRVATAGSILGALAMTSCCILPLVLFSLGATGAWIGRMGGLYPYKWMFLSFAALSLAYGFRQVYWPRTCPDGSCARPLNRTLMKASLWSATAVVAASLVFPYIAPLFLGI